MLTKTRVLFAVATISLISACSSSDDDDDILADVVAGVIETDGEYSIEAIATTLLDSDGGTCGDATGTMTVSDNQISGSVTSTNGLLFNVNGSVSDDGDVIGGFAAGGQTLVNFSGTIEDASGSGDWQDNFDCVGTWTANLTLP